MWRLSLALVVALALASDALGKFSSKDAVEINRPDETEL